MTVQMPGASSRRNARVVVAENVHFRQFDDEIVLLHLGCGDYFGLNEVGTRMWVCLANGLSPEEIAHQLAAQYDIEPDILVEDCLMLIDDLVRNDLVLVRET